MISMVVMDVWGLIDRRYEVIWWLVVMIERKWDVLVMMTDGQW
jgi:hypothetical protein